MASASAGDNAARYHVVFFSFPASWPTRSANPNDNTKRRFWVFKPRPCINARKCQDNATGS
jgi:hypothetical protein